MLIDATWLNDSSLKWVHITVWTDEHFKVGAIVYLKKHGERLCLKDWAEERCFPQDTEICPVTYLYKISKVSGHVWTRFTLDWYNVGKCFRWGRAAFHRWLFSHVYSCWENVQKSSECPRWRKLCAAFKKMILFSSGVRTADVSLKKSTVDRRDVFDEIYFFFFNSSLCILWLILTLFVFTEELLCILFN